MFERRSDVRPGAKFEAGVLGIFGQGWDYWNNGRCGRCGGVRSDVRVETIREEKREKRNK